MKKVTYFMVVAIFSFAACNNDEKIENIDNEPMELRLTSGIEVQQTRATNELDMQLRTGETVYVWVDDAITEDPLYGKNELTVEENGGLTGGTPMYFPQTGNNVNIYALHTNADLDDVTAYPDDEFIHEVHANQRFTSNYATSDLVYAKAEDVYRQTEAVELTFKHLLSKVEVVLKEGNGPDGFLQDISSLELLNLKYEARFTLNKSDDVDDIDIEIVSGPPGSTRTDIEIDTDITGEGDDILNEAIIVPQEVAEDTPFIQITLEDGSEFVYRMASTTEFESGKKYKYVITANQAGLGVTSEISDWDDDGGGDEDGSAEMMYP